MSIIEIQNLSKKFPRVTALDRLTLDVGAGVTGLVGANGAGKSTLIKVLLGLLPASSGSARVLGFDVLTDGESIRQRVGYMPEHDCLPADVSATEFVVHLARMSGLPPSSARERAADTLRHVGLYEERYRPIGGYSTGMRQRVKLAQALAHDPDLILLDEPTNGLDPAGRDDMLELVRRIGTEFGITVLVTSHLLGELERVCDSVAILDTGTLLRSSAIGDFTQATRTLAVEVVDRGSTGSAVHVLAIKLDQLGLRTKSDGRLLAVDIVDDGTYDVVRDAVAGLDLSLVRMQQRHHRIEEVFRDESKEVAGVGSV